MCFQSVEHVITARIRRMREGTVFSLSVHTSIGGGVPHPRSGRGGYPIPGQDRGLLHTRSEWRGYPILLMGGEGIPISGLDLGVPHPADGGYPSKIRTGGYPILLTGGTPSNIRTGGFPGVPPIETGWGTLGYPHLDWMGYLHLGLDGVPPSAGWGTPIETGWDVPPSRTGLGTPQSRSWMG